MSEKINKNISEIDLENGVFRKHVPSDKFRGELQMNKEARKLTLNNGLFEVPDIKFADAENYVIEFELIKDIKISSEPFENKEGKRIFVSTIGITLTKG